MVCMRDVDVARERELFLKITNSFHGMTMHKLHLSTPFLTILTFDCYYVSHEAQMCFRLDLHPYRSRIGFWKLWLEAVTEGRGFTT